MRVPGVRLRDMDLNRAPALKQQWSDLAGECGPEVRQAWQGFGLEVPNEGGCFPACEFRSAVDPPAIC